MDIFLDEKKKYIAAATALTGCLLMIIYSDVSIMAAKKGIALWAVDVAPAMMPFFICVNFLSSTGVIRYLPQSIFPFAVSVLSGYPMGAKVIGDMYRNDMVSQREAKRLISFCSTSGPVFIIGAVGTGMLGSHEAGIIAAVSHYMGALCNCLLFSRIYKKSEMLKETGADTVSGSLIEKFTESIFSSFRSLGVILAYMVIFMFITDMLDHAGVFGAVSQGAGICLARGLFEMTVGCSFITAADLSAVYECVLASVIISWGGLSIIGQTISMLAGTGISVVYIVITKLAHSFFAGIIALFISVLML